MSAGRKARGGVSFAVRHSEPEPARPVGLYMAGAIALGWIAAIGLAWTAYVVLLVAGIVQ